VDTLTGGNDVVAAAVLLAIHAAVENREVGRAADSRVVEVHIVDHAVGGRDHVSVVDDRAPADELTAFLEGGLIRELAHCGLAAPDDAGLQRRLGAAGQRQHDRRNQCE